MTFRAFTFDSRFSIESGKGLDGKEVTPITFHPAGFFSSVTYEHQRPAIIANYGPHHFSIEQNNDGPWWFLMDGFGSVITKFIMPTTRSDRYTAYRFICNGIWYVLEIRIDRFMDE